MTKARNLFLLIFNLKNCCSSAFSNSHHSVRCSESIQNGIEMKITVEKNFLEEKFPFRKDEFTEINGFYQKTVFQDQLEIEFEDQDCKFLRKINKNFKMYIGFSFSYYLRGKSSWFFGPGLSRLFEL